MRILYVVHQYAPERVGGTELYTQSVAQAMARRGHEVAVFHRALSGGTGLSQQDDGGVRVWATAAGSTERGPAEPGLRFLASFGSPQISRDFRQVLEATRPDIVHVQHMMGLPLQIIGMVREAQAPYVVTLHDYWWVCANAQLVTNDSEQLCEGPALWLNCGRCALARAGLGALWPLAPGLAPMLGVRGRLLRSALAGAREIIAPSSFVAEWYRSHAPQLPPAGRVTESAGTITVLPHGIERPPAPGGGSSPRGPGEALRFACIGGLSWQKGVHVVVEAFARLHGQAELWIAGDEARDLAYVAGLRERAGPQVRFLGKLDRQGVWDTLRAADVLLLPSLWHETFSLIAHEAFAAATPVLASQVGALTEAVSDGVDGLLLPPGDVEAWHRAMQSLIDDRARVARLRSAVRAPMTMEEHLSRLEDIYEGARASYALTRRRGVRADKS